MFWRTHLFWWTPPVVASLYIQAEIEKTRTWKNSVFGYFSRNWWAKWYVVPLNHQPKPLCWLISTYLLTDYNLVRSQSLLHYLKMNNFISKKWNTYLKDFWKSTPAEMMNGTEFFRFHRFWSNRENLRNWIKYPRKIWNKVLSGEFFSFKKLHVNFACNMVVHIWWRPRLWGLSLCR